MSDPDAGTSQGKPPLFSRQDLDRLVMQPTGRRRLGKYVLLGRIGHGGMGKIYLAYAPGPHGIEKLLVVKRLHSHLTNDPLLVASFIDEARLSMALSHPNIVTTFDVGDVDGRYFMVMEYIDGQNLGVVLRTAKRSGAYPPSRLWAGLFTHVLEGLHAAHQARDARGRPLCIIHRDVSPQNVLITYDGIPKLVDFGIAKAAMRVSETDAGVLKGKYAYMSPEQVRGETLDARSDVFAAGVVLWEMLAGRRLFKAESIVRSVERILTEAPISPVRINAECDPELARVAVKALDKERERRFSSANEMKEALEDALARSGARARQSDVRELMRLLFADVIERQRAVLEVALSASEGPVVDDDEPLEKDPNDSESDVSMRDLRVIGDNEHTTPSLAKRSPMVTGDSELHLEDAASRTSVERRAPAPTAVPAAAAAEPSSRVTSQAPTITAHTGPDATETASVAPPRRRRLASAAALLLCLGLLAAGVWRLSTAPSREADIEADAGLALRAADAGTPVVVAVVVDAATSGLVADAGDPLPHAPVDAGAVTSVGSDEPIEDSARAPPSRRAKKPPPVAKDVDTAVVAPVEPRREPAVAEAPAGGFLSLDTVPWTIVYLGERKLGETPLVNVPVPAGELELLLVNSDVGIKEMYLAKVKPGETFRQRLDLQ